MLYGVPEIGLFSSFLFCMVELTMILAEPLTHDVTGLHQPSKPCQLCGNPKMVYFPIGRKNQFWYCPQCELYQDGQLVDVAAYQWDYHAGYDRDKRRKTRTATYRLARVAGVLETTNPKILEVGCSVGSTLAAAKKMGWEAIGLDVDPAVIQSCQESGYDALVYDGVEIPFAENSFDALVSWHVIEHVPKVRQTLADWYRVLKPGGILALETPDALCPKVRRRGASYQKFWAAEHTYTFNPTNLAQFAGQAGFQVIAEPNFGRLSGLTFSDACYSVAYRAFVMARKWCGGEKAFQLFARKPAIALSHSKQAVA
jgi:2-polyprenyl-3-methyl-5-hydroxy-6-metoxy-1,4-benzoquinol methylase